MTANHLLLDHMTTSNFESHVLKPTWYTPMMLAESLGILRFKGYVADGYDVLDPRDSVITGTVYAHRPALRASMTSTDV
ncbi:Uncharacterised protein [Burkholderia pseudomallei]|nr:Uncharacterised protein [Burkholderia pseudomallei]